MGVSPASRQWPIVSVSLAHVVMKQSSAALYARDPTDPAASPDGASYPLLGKTLTALVWLEADLVFPDCRSHYDLHSTVHYHT